MMHDDDGIRELLVDEIRRIAEEVGRTPKLEDVRQHGKCSRGLFRSGGRFDGWNGALRAAGFNPNMPNMVSEADAISAIQRAAKELGRQPTYDDLGNGVEYSSSVYERIFGTWDDALEAAGFEPWEPPSGKDNPNWNGGVAEIVCERSGCEETREVAPSRVERSRFCSQKCQNKWFRESGAYSGKNNPSWDGGPVEIVCGRNGCEETREVSPAQLERSRFCSKKCQNKWMCETDENVGENHHQYKGGGPWSYGPNWEGQREKARKRDGYTCQSCGISEDDHSRELSVHHIKPIRWFRDKFDGPEWYEKGNDLDNVITLCDSCHPKWEQMAPLRPDTINAAAD